MTRLSFHSVYTFAVALAVVLSILVLLAAVVFLAAAGAAALAAGRVADGLPKNPPYSSVTLLYGTAITSASPLQMLRTTEFCATTSIALP